MKISSIIAGKKVETISASASVHDLVNSLNTHHVGALVVSGDAVSQSPWVLLRFCSLTKSSFES